MPFFKNLKRKCFEKFNIYIYFFIPAVVVTVYLLCKKIFNFNLNSLNTFNYEVINISLAFTGILLTLMGLFASLPNSEFIQLLKKYNHDKILYRTLFLGTISFFITILLSIFEVFSYLKPIFFLIGISESIIASINIYLILIYLE